MSDGAKEIDLTDVAIMVVFNGTPYHVQIERTRPGEPMGSVHFEVVKSGKRGKPEKIHEDYEVLVPDVLKVLNGVVAHCQNLTAKTLAGEVKEGAGDAN